MRTPAPKATPTLEQLAAMDVHLPGKNGRRSRNRPLLDLPPTLKTFLQEAHHHFSRVDQDKSTPFSHTAEWLLDNDYIVQQALRQIRADLPRSFHDDLPILTETEWDGYPRIYLLGRSYVRMEQGEIAAHTLHDFLSRFQTIRPLRIGELWALPIILRIAILETLSAALAADMDEDDPAERPPLHPSSALSPAALTGTCIRSLRTIARQDWRDFFESASLVEQALRQDPAYAGMTFQSRDRYRKVVEKLARATGRDELSVAHEALELAAPLPNDPKPESQPRERHIGTFLVTPAGRRTLEETLNYRPPAATRLYRRLIWDYPTFSYLSAITLLTTALFSALLTYAGSFTSSFSLLLLTGALILIPSLSLATEIINQLVPLIVPPRPLPKMNFEDGIPSYAQTIVVIPCLLASEDGVHYLLERLERHYLANTDPYLTFALLTDYADSAEEVQPEDQALLKCALQGIKALNERYPEAPFYLFHRRRLWNPQEETWMGWERKRGKLEEFNQLLSGAEDTTYSRQVGDLSRLPQIRYVITLDADTILPRGTAQRMVGAIAHPLNAARFDNDRGRITAGYAILQPRTEIEPLSAGQTRFSRLFSGSSGLDLYSHAVSDVYQDLFGEGIYVGKGIYDVAALRRSLDGRIPENSLLSHDLFEGLHARAALVTDIVLYEDYPPGYLTYTHRLHRWIRGDWQLLPWLLPQVPHRTKPSTPNPLTAISLWKIFDNLRRSLLPPALVILLAAGWLWLPGSALLWTFIAILTPAAALPALAVNQFVQQVKQRHVWTAHDFLPQSVREHAWRWLLFLVFLPYEAILSLDAILTVLFRLFVSRKHLLQWTTAARATSLIGRDQRLGQIWREMIEATLLAAILAAAVLWIQPDNLAGALPLLLAWFLSPALAGWLEKEGGAQQTPLNPEETRILRRLARATWLYFEQFVGPVDHWLPPDHFQQQPRGLVAHRTSPTNIGLALLSAVGAFDLGFLGMWELSLRLRNSLDTLDSLETFKGHFLNWYDTRTLSPLPPRYVSTVDSGNLAACLITLQQSCLEMAGVIFPRRQRWEGLADTLGLLREAVAELPEGEKGASGRVHAQIDDLITKIRQIGRDPADLAALLRDLSEREWPQVEKNLVDAVGSTHPSTEVLHQIRTWSERTSHTLLDMERRFDQVAPWLFALVQPPVLFQKESLAAGLKDLWIALSETLPEQMAVEEIPQICRSGLARLAALQEALAAASFTGAAAADAEAAGRWCSDLFSKMQQTEATITNLLASYQDIHDRCDKIVRETAFDFLYDTQRRLFHIGYNVDSETIDPNYYDLLASEARTASLIAIAKGDIPQRHWLHLGRPLKKTYGRRGLMSWSGSMFEYLMPLLWIRHYDHSLLRESIGAAVEAQIAYADKLDLPWGISESGYFRFDAAMNYQYQAFGVPDLAFKRGLEDDQVISPYASILALPLQPQAVLANLDRLTALGLWGTYGFFEAIDYTSSRLPLGQEQAVIRSFMVHHQGMILLTLTNALRDELMQRRFHAHPRIQSVELLLQEKIPARLPVEEPEAAQTKPSMSDRREVTAVPWSIPVSNPSPLVHYLGNGRYGLLITNAGAGFSRWQSTDLTRWRADATRDDWGMWLYLRDLDSGAVWSAATQPLPTQPAERSITFSPHQVEFSCQAEEISTHMTITVPADDDLEIRHVRLANQSDEPRRLQLVSYAEIILADQNADRRHPAFNKMFIESDILPDQNVLLFSRRPRAHDEKSPLLGHTAVVKSDFAPSFSFETDRSAFLGRQGDQSAPAALEPGQVELGRTAGAVLDPILALAVEVEIPPHAAVEVAFLTAAGPDRATVTGVLENYRSWSTIDHAFRQAKTHAEREMEQLEFTSSDLEQFQRMLSRLCYPSPDLRAPAERLAANTLGQAGLWSHAISGDYPILLARIHGEDDLKLAARLLQAHTFWRSRGLQIDLVLMNEQPGGYNQDLQSQLHRLLDRMNSDHWLQRRGGIFLLQRDTMPPADQILLDTAARIVLDGQGGSLETQLQTATQSQAWLPDFVPEIDVKLRPEISPPERPGNLQFDNGWGGFSADGREYVIYLEPGRPLPAPWSNVIANDTCGFLITETGGGFTWTINSGENRLTPWRNDPLRARSGEALYLRDEITAARWSVTPDPAGADTPHLVRHGAGCTTFTSHSHGLEQTLELFVPADAPVKIIRLRLKNRWDNPRRLTATYFAEWVLGVNRDEMQSFIQPEYVEDGQAVLVQNPYNAEFGERVAFLAADQKLHGLTTNRTEFIGRLGSDRDPAGLRRIGLSGEVRPGVDPCAALQIHVELQPEESKEVVFLLGQGANREEALAVIARFQDPAEVAAAWEAVNQMWDNLLGSVTVDTPDDALDLMLNRWLPYQTLACRIWGRSAFYQSGGAYGFRDQLQDVAALLYLAPGLAREHILRAARHQFEEGDVLHWWHPPSGRGVRTRITDDLLWLPFVTARYVAVTGDEAILREMIPFLEGEPLRPEEEDRYGQFQLGEEARSLYEHCLRAIDRGSTAGPHGLPLMGAGDWNDGMNRVGIEGRGESVWLGWFLYTTMGDFIQLCEIMEDSARAEALRERMELLLQALEEHGWDGRWYRRAYYDDGTPLGSAENAECRIDSIAQSWAVLSGAGRPERLKMALQAVDDHLINVEERLLLLFTPPFDQTSRDPGYIKGYPPGIRENGGQYTHAAVWAAWAFAERGDGRRGYDLFDLLNPLRHADSREKASRYRVEPYVTAADIYSVPPHTGRGGWTWYTGSGSWLYRFGIERLLGLQRRGQQLYLDPSIPPDWPGYRLVFRHDGTTYDISVDNSAGEGRGVTAVTVDGTERPDLMIPLTPNSGRRIISVRLG